jgi:broad specificity phosphatase PhoE
MPEYIDKRFPHGESLRDVEHRMRSFLEEIWRDGRYKKIAIFSHQIPQLALEVITRGVTWQAALKDDWRRTKAFQYGWDYTYSSQGIPL